MPLKQFVAAAQRFRSKFAWLSRPWRLAKPAPPRLQTHAPLCFRGIPLSSAPTRQILVELRVIEIKIRKLGAEFLIHPF